MTTPLLQFGGRQQNGRLSNLDQDTLRHAEQFAAVPSVVSTSTYRHAMGVRS